MKLTEEEKANARVNLAIILVDVAHGMLIDARAPLLRAGRDLTKKSKQDWGLLMKSHRDFTYWVKKCARPMYECEDSADSIADADEWQLAVELIMDRIGDNASRRHSFLNFLKSFTSIYGITQDETK